MGQKVSPLLQRIGYTKNWLSVWYSKRQDYAKFIEQDYKVRRLIKKRFKQAAIARIIIERMTDKIRIKIHSARPGLIIGRHGADIEKLREDLNGLLKQELAVDIIEVKEPSVEAQLIAENVALQLEKRIAFRRAMKRAIEQAMQSGAKGIKISAAGRLGGAEMSRTETYKQGKIPLSTLRADIDYGFTEAMTTYGLIGVKAWVYKGDIFFTPKQQKKPVVSQGTPIA